MVAAAKVRIDRNIVPPWVAGGSRIRRAAAYATRSARTSRCRRPVGEPRGVRPLAFGAARIVERCPEEGGRRDADRGVLGGARSGDVERARSDGANPRAELLHRRNLWQGDQVEVEHRLAGSLRLFEGEP